MDSTEPSIRPNGVYHTGIRCPKCGGEMTDLEYGREEAGDHYIWTTSRKCPHCGYSERILE